jgi:hypothetical protein
MYTLTLGWMPWFFHSLQCLFSHIGRFTHTIKSSLFESANAWLTSMYVMAFG